MKIIRLVTFSLILLSLFSAVYGYAFTWSEDKLIDKENDGGSLDAGIVRIKLNDDKFNVPLRYMYGEAIEKYHRWPKPKKERMNVDYLHVSVLLPDMRPYYSEDDAKWRTPGFGDRVEINILASLIQYDLLYKRYQYQEDLKNGRVTAGISEYGLQSYIEPSFNTYFPLDVMHQKTDISCYIDRKNSMKPKSCNVRTHYRDNIRLEYYYDANYLKNWKEIDAKIKERLNQFLQSAKTDVN